MANLGALAGTEEAVRITLLDLIELGFQALNFFLRLQPPCQPQRDRVIEHEKEE